MSNKRKKTNIPFMLERRKVLLAGASGLGVIVVAACSPTNSNISDTKEIPNTELNALKTKPTLTAQTTEGPYYFDAGKIRSDITEGMPGIPLDVEIRVVDEEGAVLVNGRVDIWHCNASGLYSGYADQGEDRKTDMKGKTFLRGTQNVDATGSVRFQTIYPGWYQGRTTHIHIKVILGNKHILTSQFFLPDALSEFLYNEVPAYKRNQLRDTLNSIDGIAIKAGETVHSNSHFEKNLQSTSIFEAKF